MSGKVLKIGSIRKSYGSTEQSKRLGRGAGSGLGKTSGKGHKGQWARKGKDVPVGFEGGQMPLYRRVPKSGFTSSRVKPYELTPDTLSKTSEETLGIEQLRKHFGKNYVAFKIILNNKSASEEFKKIAKPKKLVLSDQVKITQGARTFLQSLKWTVE